MDGIHEVLETILESNEKSVIATVIKVEGSAYRKEGASMVFMESGRQVGIISAGCLETDLALQASKLLNDVNLQSHTIVYDMSAEDDLSWGRGAGCNGKVHILLESVHSELRKQLYTVKSYLDQGIPVVSLKLLKQDKSIIQTLYIAKGQPVFGHESFFSNQMLSIVEKEVKPGTWFIADLKSNIFINYFHPKPRLFIFGAGPDVRPLSSIAAKTGFTVHIWDWRPAYRKQTYFPDASFMVHTSIKETIEKMHVVSSDSIIVMTHDFQKDQAILHQLLNHSEINYFGVLGPRKRTTRLLNSAPIPPNLHSPVGLAIGAEGPEEIAISIVAALVKSQRQGLKQKEGSLEKKRYNRDLSCGGKK